MAPSDEQLMAAVRAGDVRRAGELFDRHSAGLLEFFARRARLAADREDLVQETFLRVLKYRRSWRGEGTFAGWLFRLAENLARDRGEKAAKEPREERRSVAPAGVEIEGAAADDRAPQAQVDREESATRLHAALARLPPPERALLELKWFQGLDAAAIGARLGCSAGAVRVRLHRVHARLRRLRAGEE